MRHVELLAPAGSVESMKAAFGAGADAVYMGGKLFGARAFAKNPEDDGLLAAIDYAHIRGKRLYLTVNTLLKNRELESQLYAYLLPLYERGLDAVIVQDLGVFSFIHENFPDLPIHVSTQMTITGAHSAKLLEEMGAKRVVTARELSLAELKSIRENTSLEIETFVHGAICYCYSGQCLFSSLAGGRSGNRGRCAQPCRKPYKVYDESGNLLNSGKKRDYVLSLKDMNTIHIIKDIVGAGADSLKIEGRMKGPEYTAGVVSIYRKYLDKCLAGLDCTVEKADDARLFDLFNRNGFSEGYYKQHNGADMLSLLEPNFRSVDDEWRQFIRKSYIETESKRKINGNVIISQHLPVKMTVTDGLCEFTATADEPMEAKNRPLTEEDVNKQLRKLGDTDFEMEDLEVELGEGCFMTVKQLNELRRNAVAGLEGEILKSYLRTVDREENSHSEKDRFENMHNRPDNVQAESIDDDNAKSVQREKRVKGLNCGDWEPRYSCQVHTKNQLGAVLEEENVATVIIDASVVVPTEWKDTVDVIHEKGKLCLYHMPQVFRKRSEDYYEKHMEELESAGFDGFLLGSLEAFAFLKGKGIKGVFCADHTLYSMNGCARETLKNMGFVQTTASVELNEQELTELKLTDMELIAYGRLPMMVSANCVRNTLIGCAKTGHEQHLTLKDDSGRSFPVLCDCISCTNTILNVDPLYLLDYTKKLSALAPKSIRLIFTTENENETRNILAALHGETPDMKHVTRGHLKRGVE